MNPDDELVEIVVEHYLESDDFNGLPAHEFMEDTETELENLREWLRTLVESDKIVLRFREDGNPHIKRLPDLPIDTQIEILRNTDLFYTVIYPSNSVLSKSVDRSKYSDKPFSLRLALGEAQMDFHSFDLSVLEFYRNDPRYYYNVDDVHGKIYLQDKHAKGNQIQDKDDVYLETFGFSYGEDMNRSVATYTRYLCKLSPEHQQIWEAKRLPHRGKIHPDYYKSTIRAMFSDHIPILTAFTFELHHINEMAKAMGRSPLFRRTFKAPERPSHFNFLIRPTAKEYNDFVLLLDQTMSDNLNKKFFNTEIDLVEEIQRKDGKIEVRQKGTIALLEEWLSKNFHPEDPSPIQKMIETFKKVRRLRQKPAHSVVENEFDQKFFKEQRLLIIEAYEAIRLLRLIFSNHPSCHEYKVEELLYEGRIRDF